MSSDTLILKRSEVASLLGIDECMDAVEHAFKMRALGEAAAPGILGIHATDGGFHIKAGILRFTAAIFCRKNKCKLSDESEATRIANHPGSHCC